MKHSLYIMFILFTTLFWPGTAVSAQVVQNNETEERIQVYPNPVMQKGILEVEMDHDSHTTIEFFNLAGKRVKLLANLHFNAGINRVEFEAGELKEGFYFCKVTTDQWVRTKRFLVKR